MAKINTVIILTALEDERDAVKRYLEQQIGNVEVNEEYQRLDYVCNFSKQGTDYQIILACFEGQGNIQAIMVTMNILNEWQPDYILFTGIAAGIQKEKERHLGDLIVADPIVNFISGKETKKRTTYRPSDRSPDKDLLRAFKRFAPPNINFKQFSIPYYYDSPQKNHTPNIHYAPVACVEKVVNSDAKIKELTNYRDTLVGIEMEGYGVAEAVYNSKIEPKMLLVKAISDWAVNKEDDDWREYAFDVAAFAVVEFLNTTIDKLIFSSSNSPSIKEKELELLEASKDLLYNEDNFPFTNRTDERRELLSIASQSQYYAVHAPAGYGKTWLLQTIKSSFIQQKWLCGHVIVKKYDDLDCIINKLVKSFGLKSDESSPIYRLGLVLTKYWCTLSVEKNTIQGIVILIDLDANPNIEFATTFSKEIIPKIYNSLKEHSFFNEHKLFRVIISGRYLANHLDRYEDFSLKPFSYKVIYESVDLYLHGTSKTPNIINQFSSNLLYYTGGHPACVAEISKLYKPSNLSCSDFFQENKDKIKFIINDAIKNIYEDLSIDIYRTQKVLKKLSIFRFLDNDILDWFVKKLQLKEFKNGYSLSRKLTSTFLYDRKGRFTSDGICRKLSVIDFRNDDKTQFEYFCRKAKNIYEEKIKNSLCSEKYVIEYIFQYLQEQSCVIESINTRVNLKEGLSKEVNNILTTYVERENASELEDDKEALLKEIEQDWEFCYTLNYYLRGEEYDNVPTENLKNMIEKFFTSFHK